MTWNPQLRRLSLQALVGPEEQAAQAKPGHKAQGQDSMNNSSLRGNSRGTAPLTLKGATKPHAETEVELERSLELLAPPLGQDMWDT